MAAAATTQEKFEAAVNVIKNLPKDGPYQPSNDMKLRFYSLYKQATEGPCCSNKPAFWDVVGRVKWEAWRKLGDMTKQDAMLAYIEGLKEIALQIIETMAYTDKIAEFMESVGPFYEMVELPLPKKASYDSEDQDDEPKMSGMTAIIISKRVGKYKQLQFILRAKAKNENLTNENELGGNNLNHDEVNGDVDWTEETALGFHENGHANIREGIADNFYSSNESDDEFSDPMDNDGIAEEVATESNGTFVHVDGLQISSEGDNELCKSGEKSNVMNGPISGVVFRGGGDPMAPTSQARMFGAELGGRNVEQYASSSRSATLGSSVPVRRAMGAGGGKGHVPRGGGSNVTEQIAVALSQLQRDMESVLTRLNTLEALTVAHHNMAQGHLITQHTIPTKSNVPSWWLFKNMPFKAVAFFIAWPVIYHLIIQLISISRSRRMRNYRR